MLSNYIVLCGFARVCAEVMYIVYVKAVCCRNRDEGWGEKGGRISNNIQLPIQRVLTHSNITICRNVLLE